MSGFRLARMIPTSLALLAGLATSHVAEDELVSVLLIDGQNNHNWQATTPVLVGALESTGRFTVEVATAPPRGQDVSGFAPAFASYDVVVSNYNGEEWSEQTKADFEAYVRGGGGFVCVHAADNAFPGWRAYNEMIGVGGWGGRNESFGPYLRLRDGEWVHDESKGRGGSHGRRHEFLVERRAQHPIMEGLPDSWRHNADELYDRLRGPALNVTVLASAFSSAETGGSDEHEPLLMVVPFGEGRAFHTTLGHDVTAMLGVGFQTTFTRGTEWAATGSVTLPVASDFPTADRSSSRDPRGYVELFDGETLEGWTQRNGSATYRVENGAVVGKTSDGSPNSFLCTNADYDDFELVFSVKVDAGLNSGVQIRSKSLEEFKRGRVHGPQVEVEWAPGESGHIYSEGTGRGWISSSEARHATRDLFRNEGWNHYRVLAEGPRIRTWLNGQPAGDIADEESSRSGFIGLQVHSIGRGRGPFEVRWRGIRIRPLP